MGLGFGELLIIGLVLLVVFSASRMGQLGNAVGKFVYSFKKASQGQDFVDVAPKRGTLKGARGTEDAALGPDHPRPPRR